MERVYCQILKSKMLLVAGLGLILSVLAGSGGLFAKPLVVEAQAEEVPVVRAFLFHSETCPACRNVRENVIPVLYSQFNQQLRIRAIDIGRSEAEYRWLQACEEAYGVSEEEAAIPILFVGDEYLIGDDIATRLPLLVQEYLDKGGVDWPDVPPPEGVPEPTAHFAFFFSPTCPHCRHVEENVFPQIEAKYGDRVTWDKLDTSV